MRPAIRVLDDEPFDLVLEEALRIWTSKGELNINACANAHVGHSLERYDPPATDSALDVEASTTISSGLSDGTTLPA